MDKYDDHREEDWDEWEEASAAEKRILITKWVGEAWDDLVQNNYTTIMSSFTRTGVFLPVDGSQDHLVKVRRCRLTST